MFWQFISGSVLDTGCSVCRPRVTAAFLVAPQGVRTSILHLDHLQEGDYTFTLKVTDSSGQVSTADVHVFVKPGKLSPVSRVVSTFQSTSPQCHTSSYPSFRTQAHIVIRRIHLSEYKPPPSYIVVSIFQNTSPHCHTSLYPCCRTQQAASGAPRV